MIFHNTLLPIINLRKICYTAKFRYIVIDAERRFSEVESPICLEKPAGNKIGNNFKEGLGVSWCTFLTKGNVHAITITHDY